MKYSYLFIIFVFILFNCNVKNSKVYYIYDTENIFKIDTIGSIISYSISKPIYSSWDDSISFEISKKGYFLMHNQKINSSVFSDTTIIKNESFLDSIKYFNSDWFKNEENLNRFWEIPTYFNDGKSDSLKIYFIKSMRNTDSISIKRVHRFFIPGREG